MSAGSPRLEIGVSGGARGQAVLNSLNLLFSPWPQRDERGSVSQNQPAKSIALTWHFSLNLQRRKYSGEDEGWGESLCYQHFLLSFTSVTALKLQCFFKFYQDISRDIS